MLDEYTFKVVLKALFAPFLSRLANGLGAIVSPTTEKAKGAEKFSLSPVGTGPLRFAGWKNDTYVRLDQVEWRIVSEPANHVMALQAGDMDLVESGRIRDQDLGLMREDANLVVKQQTSASRTLRCW